MDYETLRYHGVDARLDCLNQTLQLIYGVGSPTIVERLINPAPMVLEAQEYTSYGMETALLPILTEAVKEYLSPMGYRNPEAVEVYNYKMAKAYFSPIRALSFRDLRMSIQGVGESDGHIKLLANFAWLFYRLVLEGHKLTWNQDFSVAARATMPSWFPRYRDTLQYQNCGMAADCFELIRASPTDIPVYLEALIFQARAIATEACKAGRGL